MGTMATRKSGVDLEMTTTTEAMLKKQERRDFMELGMDSSVALMSLVNLLRIRPVGVDSKNRQR